MPDRARTLLLYASGMPRTRRVVADSLRGFVPAGLRRVLAASPIQYVRSVFVEEYESLSYAVDWRDAFAASDRLDCVSCNVNDAFGVAAASRRIREFDLIVVLHSAAGDSLSQLRRIASSLSQRRGVLLVLFGNEYDAMAQKRALLRDIAADFVGSQLPLESARWLFDGCGSTVLPAPAGLNDALYRPGPVDRPIDIGFRGDRYLSALIGDDERARILDHFARGASARGLRVDIAFKRLPRREWSGFLARCKGTIGAEAGTHYLERDDKIRQRAARYITDHPEATLSEVIERCYPSRETSISGKAVSSRHFEAAGTKTCQLLVEGKYNGIFVADEHYIAVRPDLANIEAALGRFNDPVERGRIADAAHALVLSEHTYEHRVTDLLRHVFAPRSA